jgi:predicted TPR repeat methyltransferase
MYHKAKYMRLHILKKYHCYLLLGVRLLSSGRFGHTEKYIRKLADDLNFTVITAQKEVLRLQSETPVNSITFTLRK